MELKVYRFVVPLTVVTLCAALWMFYEQKGEADEANKRLHEICRFSKAALEITARAIRSKSPGTNEDIRLVYGHGELTNQFVLGACTPSFDRDAWLAGLPVRTRTMSRAC